MKTYFKTDSSGGDFSTSFGDMIFGLLFFFFILTLAMVFNRTDVDGFQKEIDALRKEIARKEEALAQWEKQHKEWKDNIEKLRKEKQVDSRKLRKLQEDYELLRKQYVAVLSSLEMTQNEYNKLLKQTPEPPEKQARNIDAQEIQLLKQQMLRIEQERNRLKTQVDTLQKQIKQIKQILKDKGLVTILAEVEKMEKGEKKKSGEGEENRDYKIWVKLYPYDFDMKLSKGDAEMASYSGVTEEEVIRSAEEIVKRYGSETASYSEEERQAHKPKLFLMTHPEVQYGTMQKFLEKSRKVIGVSIVPWKE